MAKRCSELEAEEDISCAATRFDRRPHKRTTRKYSTGSGLAAIPAGRLVVSRQSHFIYSAEELQKIVGAFSVAYFMSRGQVA